MPWLLLLVYAALIWLIFVKLKCIHLALPIAIVLAVGPLVLFYIAWAVRLYHPHSSDVQALRRIVEVAPRTSRPGRVTEVMVGANNPLKRGVALFTVDPQPFEFEVDRLRASLAALQQGAPELQAALDKAIAARKHAEAQTTLVLETYEQQVEFGSFGAVSQAAVDAAKRNLEAAVQSEADARAAEERARLELTSASGDGGTAVALLRQQLADAANDLAETKVIAPCDGFVPSIDILPGQIVGAGTAVVPFVCDVDEETRDTFVATFPQGAYPGVKAGAAAEVIFPMYPGRVFTAKVADTTEITDSGQIRSGGIAAAITLSSAELTRFAVILKLDDPNLRLLAGVHGEAAVYTDHAPLAGKFRKSVIRIETTINYLFSGK